MMAPKRSSGWWMPACVSLLVSVSGPILAQPARKDVAAGNKFFQQGKFDEAQRQYEQALREDPDSAGIRFNVGDALFKKKSFQEASKSFLDAVQSEDAELKSKAFYNLGNSLFRQGKLAQSILAYQRALRILPHDPDAKYNLEFAQEKLKQKQKSPPQKGDKGREQEQKKDRDQAPTQKRDQQQQQRNSEGNQSPRGQKEQSEEKQKEKSSDVKEDQPSQQQHGKEQKQAAHAPSDNPEQASQMSREDAEQLLEALQEDLKGLKIKRVSKSQRRRVKKDW
ncbi:MAG: tetratricopeptide repeat protein [Acidobacteriota bacterium]